MDHTPPTHREREPLYRKTERVLADRDLMWVVFGIELALGGLVAYLGLMMILAVGAFWSGLVALLLGGLVMGAAAIPRWRPVWLERLGVENPLF